MIQKYCKICHKNCSLSNMSVTTLKKHMQRQIHNDIVAKNNFLLLLLATASSSQSVIQKLAMTKQNLTKLLQIQ